MNNINYNCKKVIWSFYASLVLWTLGAHAAPLPPDPNNAALLYYQAVALWSDVRSSYADTDAIAEPNEDLDTRPSTGNSRFDFSSIDRVMRELEKKDRESSRLFMRRQTIKLVEAASRIPQCTWGNKEWNLPPLAPLKHLALLLEDDSRALAAAGDYRAALERCLTIRRLARHHGDEYLVTHTTSLGVDSLAFKGIQQILGLMPADAKTLAWLQDQLAAIPGVSRSPTRALKTNFELAVQAARRNPKLLRPEPERDYRECLAGKDIDSSALSALEKWLNMTDEELVSRSSQAYSRFLDAVLRVISSNKPYVEKSAELDRLHDRLYEQAIDNLALYFLMELTATDVAGFYEFQISHTVHFNCLRAAIEIYLIKAKTGQLPETLPDGLPKDPYSGRDFEYERTEEGFILRCRVKAIDESRVRQYKFKALKEGQTEVQP